MPALLINNVDAATFGFILTEAPSWIDLPPRQTPTQPVINRQGVTVTAAPIEAARRVVLRGFVTSASVATTRANIDALKAALLAPLVQLIFQDNATRYVTVGLDSFTVGFQGPALIERRLRVEIQMTAYDPYFYDVTPSSVLFNVAGTPPGTIGTGIIRPVLTLTGAATGPTTIQLTDKSGVAVSTMTIAGNTIGGDVVVVDNDARTIKKNGTSIISSLSGGDFFAIDPSDPRFNSTPFWYFYLTAGGPGNANSVVSYRRTWR